MKKIILIIFLFILLSCIIPEYTVISQNNNQIDEKNVYKLMYENVKDSNKKILQTVYWSLSSILIVIIAILGSNIYYNYKVNKQEIENLKQEIDTHINEVKNEIYNSISKNFNDYTKDTRTELKNDVEKYSESYIKQLNLLEENLKNRIEINTEYSNKLYDQLDKIYNIFKDTFQKIDDTSEKLEEKIENNHQKILIDIYDIKAQLMESNSSLDLALMYYASKLKIEIDIDSNCENTLNDIISIIKRLDSLPQHNNYDLNEIIFSVPNKYEAQKEIIISLIKKIND